MRKLYVCDIGKSLTDYRMARKRSLSFLGDRWWPQTAKLDGDRISKQFLCNIWNKKRNQRRNVEGVCIRSRN